MQRTIEQNAIDIETVGAVSFLSVHALPRLRCLVCVRCRCVGTWRRRARRPCFWSSAPRTSKRSSRTIVRLLPLSSELGSRDSRRALRALLLLRTQSAVLRGEEAVKDQLRAEKESFELRIIRRKANLAEKMRSTRLLCSVSLVVRCLCRASCCSFGCLCGVTQTCRFRLRKRTPSISSRFDSILSSRAYSHDRSPCLCLQVQEEWRFRSENQALEEEVCSLCILIRGRNPVLIQPVHPAPVPVCAGKAADFAAHGCADRSGRRRVRPHHQPANARSSRGMVALFKQYWAPRRCCVDTLSCSCACSATPPSRAGSPRLPERPAIGPFPAPLD